MGQEKMKGRKGPGQKHLHSRISYLYQAATYLASAENGPTTLVQAAVEEMERDGNPTYSGKTEQMVRKVKPSSDDGSKKEDPQHEKALGSTSTRQSPLSHLFINHLKAVSLKSQIRLTPAMKHSFCKRCDVLLIPGSTSTRCIENKSRGGKKPWADVFIVTCNSCQTVKRFPLGAKRQPRKPDRVRHGKRENPAT